MIFTKQEVDILAEMLRKKSMSDESLEKVKDEFELWEKVTVRLAIEPSIDLVEKIKSRIGQHLDNFLVDIKMDPNLIGGAIIEYKGKYSNYSLESLL